MIEKLKNCSVVLSGFNDKTIDYSLYNFMLQNNINFSENTTNSTIKAVITYEDVDFIPHKSAKIKRSLMTGIPVISLSEIKEYMN
tara:strand:- start:193 stop:447 length:255 start_codon:yes stop_codon:yes gene_type:complete